MTGSLMRLMRGPLSQELARANARQAAGRLARLRREREEVDAFLAQLSAGSRRPDEPGLAQSGGDLDRLRVDAAGAHHPPAADR